MYRIIIFADTHGDISSCVKLMKMIPGINACIHAGDYVRDAEDLKRLFPDIPLYYVKGNNDLFLPAKSKLLLELGGKRIFVTHGHEERVKYDENYSLLIGKAKAEHADLCIFGHTHSPYLENLGYMTLLNPGSVRYGGTYAICEIEDGKMRNSVIDI